MTTAAAVAAPAAPAAPLLSTVLTVGAFAAGLGLMAAGLWLKNDMVIGIGASVVTAKAISFHWGSIALAKLPTVETGIEDVEQYGPALLKFLPANLQPIAQGLLSAGVGAETIVKALEAAQGAPPAPTKVAIAAAAGADAGKDPKANL